MKYFLSTLMLLLVTLTISADPITPQRARSIAANFMKTENAPSRVKRSMDRSVSEDAQQPVYVYNRGVNQGIIIVSGDDCLPEVLGYTEGGDYDEEKMPPALKGYIQYYAEMIDSIQKSGGAQKMPMKAPVLDHDISQILSTAWHQSSPYNDQCPLRLDGGGHALVGCVSTATSQITYYWGKKNYCNRMTQYDTPTYGYGDAPVTYSIPAGTPLHWELMGSTASADNKEALSTLNFVTGVCAWLTYGSSTGGYIWDEIPVMENQYGLRGGKTEYRSSYSNEQWMKMCAEDLAAGHPILYSGYTTEWAGHAFVMDGYQQEDNKFHFNYGWGAGWDGFFTLDDCRGYGTGQIMVYQIQPIELDIAESFGVPGSMLKYNEVEVSAEMTNNGNEIVHGLYLIPGNSPTSLPVNLNDAIACYEGDIKKGQTVELSGKFRNAESTVYLYLMDKRCRLIAKSDKYSAFSSKSGLVLKSLALDQDIDGTMTRTINDDTEKEITAYKITDLEATLKAVLENSASSSVTDCMPKVSMYLYSYNEETHKFNTVPQIDAQYMSFKAGGQNEMSSSFPLEANTLYKALINKVIAEPRGTLSDPDNINCVYIQTVGTPLTATVDGFSSTISGTYGKIGMQRLMNDSSIASFDVTGVEKLKADIASLPVNPNAVIYATAEQGVSGRNIIVDGKCENLELVQGFNFQPKNDFVAESATFTPDEPLTKWGTMVLPFDAETPMGMLVRMPKQVGSRKIQDCENGVLELKACTPYLIREGEHKTISAKNVNVTTSAESTCAAEFKPLFQRIITDGTQYVLNSSGTYFGKAAAGDTVQAMTGYSSAYFTTTVDDLKDVDVVNKNIIDTLSTTYLTLKAQMEFASEARIAELKSAILTAETALTMQNGIDNLSSAYENLLVALHHFIEDPTEINEIAAEGETANKSTFMYDLAGRRVKDTTKAGIYIINGHKLLK